MSLAYERGFAFYSQGRPRAAHVDHANFDAREEDNGWLDAAYAHLSYRTIQHLAAKHDIEYSRLCEAILGYMKEKVWVHPSTVVAES